MRCRSFGDGRSASKVILGITLALIALYGAFRIEIASNARRVNALRMDRTLPESLIANRPASQAEIDGLEAALARYRTSRDFENVQPITDFMKSHPQSPWDVSLLTNLGSIHYQYGYFGKAIDDWGAAWVLGKTATEPAQRAIAEQAFGELVRMHARLGHAPELKVLLTELGDRKLIGSASEMVTGAREGLWMMQNNPGVAYLCGPKAVLNVMNLVPHDPGAEARVDSYQSGRHGVSLAEVGDLAVEAGMDYVVARRIGLAEIPVPSVIHWKVNHYAAIVGYDNGRFHIKDPTFGDDLWLSQQAIDSESSGYFLVPSRLTGHGWRAVQQAEAQSIFGMGYTTSLDPNATRPYDEKECDDKCTDPITGARGMPQYSVHSMLTSLNLEDVPVGYSPPRGPAIHFVLTYNQREANQPAVPSYGNIGPKWTTNWLSYVTDNPAQPGQSVSLAVPGGGTEKYSGYNSTTGEFARENRLAALLARRVDGTGNVYYERKFSDGTIYVYAFRDSGASSRRIFLTNVIDPAGNTVTLQYDSQFRLTAIQDALGRSTSLEYLDPLRPLLLTKITDPFGRYALIGYDANGRLQGITDAIGMTSTFGYDSGSFIQAMTTPYGTTNFAYQDSGTNGITRWLTATDPLGHAERFETTQNSGIPDSESPIPSCTGITLSNTYLGGRNSFYWDKDAYPVAATDYTQARLKHWVHNKNSTTQTYPALESTKMPGERRVWFRYPGQASANKSGTLDRPSAALRVLDDGSSQCKTWTYNAAGLVTKQVDPLGRQLDYIYSTNNIDLTQIKRKNGAGFDVIASYGPYNAMHLPSSYTDAAGQTTTLVYNSFGQMTRLDNPLGQFRKWVYDANGYLTSIRNANDIVEQSYTYDAYDRVASFTDSEGYQVLFEYDDLDRLTKKSYPDSSYEQYTYDKLDLHTSRDRLGRLTTYTHNAVRQLTQVDEPLPRTIQYEWTPAGRLQMMTDGEGRAIRWEYDIVGRPLKEVHVADGSETTYAYDLTGRLRTAQDALNQVKSYTYYKDDSLKGIGYANAVNPTASVGFSYDPVYPRRAAMTDGLGTTSFNYKPVGTLGALQPYQEDGPYTHDVTAYGYDALGRVSSRSVDGSTETWAYDALGRLDTKNSPMANYGFSYLGQTDQVTSRIGIQLPAAVALVASYSYDDNAHDRALKSIQYLREPLGGGIPVPMVEYRYQRNAIGNIVGTDEVPNGNESLKKHWDVGYDDADRVTSFTPATTGWTFGYGYDRADNRTSANLNGSSQSSIINALNQATTVDGQAYQYDLNGNLTNDGTNQYDWDAENRLIRVTLLGMPGSYPTEYKYDGLSRRLVIKNGGLPQFNKETRYVWCGEKPCQQRDSSDVVLARYYDEGESNGGFYLQDQLGSVRQSRNQFGTTIYATKDYGPYGESVQSSGTSTRFGYAGMFYHAQTGLYLTQYRAYHARTGRWLSRDPIGIAGGLNLYAYVGGNPISYVDPLGLEAGGGYSTGQYQMGQPTIPTDPCSKEAMADLAVNSIPAGAYIEAGMDFLGIDLNFFTDPQGVQFGNYGEVDAPLAAAGYGADAAARRFESRAGNQARRAGQSGIHYSVRNGRLNRAAASGAKAAGIRRATSLLGPAGAIGQFFVDVAKCDCNGK